VGFLSQSCNNWICIVDEIGLWKHKGTLSLAPLASYIGT
jgi:hypothetical protein